MMMNVACLWAYLSTQNYASANFSVLHCWRPNFRQLSLILKGLLTTKSGCVRRGCRRMMLWCSRCFMVYRKKTQLFSYSPSGLTCPDRLWCASVCCCSCVVSDSVLLQPKRQKLWQKRGEGQKESLTKIEIEIETKTDWAAGCALLTDHTAPPSSVCWRRLMVCQHFTTQPHITILCAHRMYSTHTTLLTTLCFQHLIMVWCGVVWCGVVWCGLFFEGFGSEMLYYLTIAAIAQQQVWAICSVHIHWLTPRLIHSHIFSLFLSPSLSLSLYPGLELGWHLQPPALQPHPHASSAGTSCWLPGEARSQFGRSNGGALHGPDLVHLSSWSTSSQPHSPPDSHPCPEGTWRFASVSTPRSRCRRGWR